jgi:hypothetical protein
VFNDNVVKLIQPGILTDRLTEVLRDGARALLTGAGPCSPAGAIIDTARLCGSVGATAGTSALSTEETFATVTRKAAALLRG